MLKFLTHKLKTHSLNEENPAHHKVEDDDHDSGTESDDELDSSDEPDFSMESEGGSVITALSRSRSSLLTPASPSFLDSALPSDTDLGYDQHSSEEELEVINCSQQSSSSSTSSVKLNGGGGVASCGLLSPAASSSSSSGASSVLSGVNDDVVRAGSADNIINGGVDVTTGSVSLVNGCSGGVNHTGQEKRKWSQVTPEGSEQRSGVGSRSHRDGSSDGSSDEDDGSPVVTTGGRGGGGGNHLGGGYHHHHHHHRLQLSSSSSSSCCASPSSSLSLSSPLLLSTSSSMVVSPAPVQFRTSPPRGTHRPSSAALHDASPRKRHRNAAPPRPCLDFEKMQQLQARAMTAWRHSSDSTGELSIYCW